MSTLQDIDPTVFTVSAWNDNGMTLHARNEQQLYRTGGVPGLGWLLSRKLWENEVCFTAVERFAACLSRCRIDHRDAV